MNKIYAKVIKLQRRQTKADLRKKNIEDTFKYEIKDAKEKKNTRKRIIKKMKAKGEGQGLCARAGQGAPPPFPHSN